MKYVKIRSDLPGEKLLETIRDSEFVNRDVQFNSNKGKPQMTVKEKGNRLRITCSYIGGASRDNGFLVGTYFTGKLTERDGVTTLSGWLLTAPVYHLALFAILVFFVVQCFRLGGFNPVPIILFLFSIFMFRDEYRKQGIIYRYLLRAFRKADGREN